MSYIVTVRVEKVKWSAGLGIILDFCGSGLGNMGKSPCDNTASNCPQAPHSKNKC